MNKRTGKKIREARIQKGITQKKLANLCGMYDSQIRKYESGKVEPKIETLQKIADALEVSLSFFLDEDYVTALKKGNDEANSLLLKNFYEAAELDNEERELAFKNLMRNQDLISEMRKDNDRELSLINSFQLLNTVGKDKAITYVEDLTKIPEYKREKKDE